MTRRLSRIDPWRCQRGRGGRDPRSSECAIGRRRALRHVKIAEAAGGVTTRSAPLDLQPYSDCDRGCGWEHRPLAVEVAPWSARSLLTSSTAPKHEVIVNVSTLDTGSARQAGLVYVLVINKSQRRRCLLTATCNRVATCRNNPVHASTTGSNERPSYLHHVHALPRTRHRNSTITTHHKPTQCGPSQAASAPTRAKPHLHPYSPSPSSPLSPLSSFSLPSSPPSPSATSFPGSPAATTAPLMARITSSRPTRLPH